MKSDLPLVDFELNGTAVKAVEGDTILAAARRAGVAIPHLCHQDGLRPDGNCRACVVEIAGERVLAPSCCRTVTPGMKVQSDNERALKSQRMVLELMLADMPDKGYKWTDGSAPARRDSLPLPAGERAGVRGAPSVHLYPCSGMSASSSSSTMRWLLRARSLSDRTFMAGVTDRQQLGASTRSPAISTTQARQLPSGR